MLKFVFFLIIHSLFLSFPFSRFPLFSFIILSQTSKRFFLIGMKKTPYYKWNLKCGVAGVFLIIIMITVIIISSSSFQHRIPTSLLSLFLSFLFFFTLWYTIRRPCVNNCLSFALLVRTRQRDDEETEFFLFIERAKV